MRPSHARHLRLHCGCSYPWMWRPCLDLYQARRYDRPPVHRPVTQHQAVEPPSPWVSAPLVIPEILVGTPLARTFTMLAESNRHLQRML
ncbi:hypothetical protein PVAP13_6NG002000 [Panicum virgatum]|uniref:Uncharacterized protein n=1 Tax=Panicum virgatum TaxID=38727 RepID=A0A8T0QSK1_PANVG|nr:hypothetical protein PVAP13_6NG002000 [Panicum virgatum]